MLWSLLECLRSNGLVSAQKRARLVLQRMMSWLKGYQQVLLLAAATLLTSGVYGMMAGGTSARVEGDFIVGALFSVHQTPRGTQGALVCDPGIREVYGIQRVETALITLDEINQDDSILPGVKLGLEARDECWSAPVALQQSLELVRDAITPFASKPLTSSNSNASDPICLSSSSSYDASNNHHEVSWPPPPPSRRFMKKAPLIGVVGPGSSSVTLQVQNFLQLFSIPQIGYSSTSKVLSDKSRYSTFLRVVPPDSFQAQLMVDVVRFFNWTYVSIVSTDENYGQSGIQAFRDIADQNGICVARENSVLSTAGNAAFDAIIMNLDQDRAANVVVCFCEGMTMRGLLAATKRLNLTGRFVFFGSDGWADRDDVVESLESQAWTSLSIRIHSPYIQHFQHHYFSLNPFNNSRNPWFAEFWQSRFNCTLPGFFDAVASKNNSSAANATTTTLVATNCTGKEKLSERYKQDSKMSFVIKSFWAMAHGLDNMLQDVCGRGYRGVCNQIYPFNGTLFKDYLMNVSFTFMEEVVEFDRRGDPPGRYEILNYQLMANGTWGYVQIGDWNNGSLTFSSYPQSRDPELLVKSVCSQPCPMGYIKNYKTGGQEKKCCWACMRCESWQYTDQYQMDCISCPAGHWPNENKTDCYMMEAEYLKWNDAEAVVAMSFSALGLVATFTTFAVFIRFNNTPVVKASTRELSYFILVGMALAHISVLPILAKPSKVSCALSRSMPGISFAMIYASLLTKTNRIARILAGSKKRFPTRKPRFMSTPAQIVITCGLVMIEAAVATGMLIAERPEPRLEYPSLNRAVLICAASPRAFLAPFACDALLLALCTLYAIKTRNLPENFNEAKFIGFAMYTTCVIWIASLVVWIGSETKVMTMCLCVTLSASVTLAFLFVPKLYIMLFHADKNNRALFTTSKSIRCHIGTRVAAAIVEPAAKQLIYRLSSSSSTATTPGGPPPVDPAKFFDSRAAAAGNNSISRPSLSVQTGTELLVGCLHRHDHDDHYYGEDSLLQPAAIVRRSVSSSSTMIQLQQGETSPTRERKNTSYIKKNPLCQNRDTEFYQLDAKNLLIGNFCKSSSKCSGQKNKKQQQQQQQQHVPLRWNNGTTSNFQDATGNVEPTTCNEDQLLECTARIRQENISASGAGQDPFINITITLARN